MGCLVPELAEIKEKAVDFHEGDDDNHDDRRPIILRDDRAFDLEMKMMPMVVTSGVFGAKIG